jgi:hypothetical protein
MKGFNKKDINRFSSLLRVHLRSDQQDMPVEDQIEALEKRGRARRWHLLINIAAIMFFGYSFYFDITQLSQTFFVIIVVVFAINVGLILYQKKQIRELVAYLQWRQHHE